MKKRSQTKISIGIITPPIGNAGVIPLSNFLKILISLSFDIHLITGNEGLNCINSPKVHISGFYSSYKNINNIFLRIIYFIFQQIQISIFLIKKVNLCNTWFFFIGGEILFIPMCLAKLFSKKTIIFFTGSSSQSMINDNLNVFLKKLTNINCFLCTYIILYSPNLINQWNLQKFFEKIIIGHEHFIDTKKFSITKKFSERKPYIGYIGRFSEEKGIINFTEALPEILKSNKKIFVLIIGTGQLNNQIKEKINTFEQKNRIHLMNWVSHDKLPDFINQFKLIIIPSFTEGLPNILLESLACGTPILATPVGAIPEIVKETEVGFIMNNNSPKSIFENVIRIINNPNLEINSFLARKMIIKNFSFETTKEHWRQIFERIFL